MEHLRLRGLNFGGWLSQIDAIEEKDPVHFPGTDRHMDTFITREDFMRQKEWGFNHVRIPIDADLFFDTHQQPVESRLTVLDRAVTWASDASVKLIIDLHECPGHDFADAADTPIQQLFVDDRYVKKTITIWETLAERYGTHRHVLFEPLNEPVAPDAATWNRIKDPLCRAIRAHAPHSSIIVGSNMWNWPSTFKDLTPVAVDNIIYNFHFYEPLLFTHQHAPWMHEEEIKHEYPYPADYGPGFTRKYGLVHSAGLWNRERILEEIEPVARFGERHGAQITCNEFGVYAPVPVQHQLHWLRDFLGLLNEFNIGFTYWNYMNLDFGIISQGEKLHANRPQYTNPERTNYEVLYTLQQN